MSQLPAVDQKVTQFGAEAEVFPQRQNAASQRQVVRASELAQYRYCARAWWLGSVLGKPSTNTREIHSGTAAHQRHGRAVWLSSALRIAAIALAALAMIVLLMALR